MKRHSHTIAIAAIALACVSAASCASSSKAQKAETAEVTMSPEEAAAADAISREQIKFLYTHAYQCLNIDHTRDAQNDYNTAQKLYRMMNTKDEETVELMRRWRSEFKEMKLL